MLQSGNHDTSESSNCQDDVRTSSSTGKRLQENTLCLGPRKKVCHADPLVHHGHHFGQTVHALCNVQALIMNGVVWLGELADVHEEDLIFEEKQEFCIFQSFFRMVPGLEEHLMEGNAEETVAIAELIQKGASSARSNDIKGLKGVVLDWITHKGKCLHPPLARNMKTNYGFNHKKTSALLCPAGLDWKNTEYDPEDPWQGLFWNLILVLVCFALSLSPVFSHTDTVTDSERFYSTVLNLLNEPEERDEVNSLLVWWNCQIFPNHYSAHRLPSKDSALAKIKEKRAALQCRQEAP
ncbi:hypothetical protein SERLA73DRAFT_119705 [Serpula lacrymans var. lacrymans S7.3]|uniref:Uncharacterized protein n=2 Tax=Serpula lacrymans var. lacrymans TaxID=341189 RepID=F8PLG4_SERL3|nr:uncharacterized protein SERLADRAFT_366050 [Serpula lacrymans var. lacrymans S7.9]EGO02446.1 hypothetical protein SERLA73DRAFT_119705 [Serpula lacrymans var. lacrymans S7.3]EGO28176.1 hypothetical protein SERLADRAFT_366050 [Serpula lacrymans var. lacrymans S7.9]